MSVQDAGEVDALAGYLLGIGQVIQTLSLPALLFASYVLGGDDTALVVATAALLLSAGNFVVLHGLQRALFEDGTRAWREWVG
jgi:hypothetical protein